MTATMNEVFGNGTASFGLEGNISCQPSAGVNPAATGADTAFSRSKFIADKLVIPVDLAQAKFGNNFYFDDGKIKAKGADGNPIYSRTAPGNLAEFDEALEILVDSYGHRDSILKGTGASGGGASGSSEMVNGKRAMTRNAFNALSPTEQMSTMKDGKTVVVD